MLAMNTERHPKRAVSSPPSSGPIAAAVAITEPKYPKARGRRSNGTRFRSNAITAGTVMAPPAAIAIRANARAGRVATVKPSTEPTP